MLLDTFEENMKKMLFSNAMLRRIKTGHIFVQGQNRSNFST